MAPTDLVGDGMFYRPPKREPLFSEEQQRVFDRAFAKRERKLRAEYDLILRDLLELAEVVRHLLVRCKDRISAEDECSISDGLQAIRREVERRNVRTGA